MTKVAYIIPYSSEDILNRWFLKSPIKDEEIITLKVTKEKSAPILLNEILDDLKSKQWLVFCNDWIRFLKKIEPVLENKKKNFLYGITGARFKKDEKKLQVFDGRTGYKNLENKIVDSIGQGCMILHSSILKKFDLKFDENFVEGYMVDFSLQCRTNDIKIAIIPVESKFKERIMPFEEEEIFRNKLRQKYSHLLPLGTFGGTLTEDNQSDLKTFLNQRENWIKTLIKEKNQLRSKVKEYEDMLCDLTLNEQRGDSSHDIPNKNEILEEKLFDKLETKLVWIFGTPRSGSTWLAHDILRKEKIRSLDETMLGAQLGAFYDSPIPHWKLVNGYYKAKFERIINRDRDDLFFLIKI